MFALSTKLFYHQWYNLFGNFIQPTFIRNHFKAGTKLANLVTNLQTNIESAQVRFVKTWPLHQE